MVDLTPYQKKTLERITKARVITASELWAAQKQGWRGQIYSALNVLRRAGLIERIGQGIYKIKE